MSRTLIVRGRYANHKFIPDEELPDTEGSAELIITEGQQGAPISIFDLFGKAPVLRSAEDIAAQIQAEREEWGKP